MKMKSNRAIIAVAAVLAVAAGGTAAGAAVLAGPIDSAGVIHGFNTLTPAAYHFQGRHV